MAETNEQTVTAEAESPGPEEVAKAIKRGVSVSEILDRERSGWFERHRGVVVKKQHSLGHPNIHKTYTRYFEKISQYLFFIPVFGRVLVAEKNHKDVMLVEQSIIKAMESTLSKLDELIGQYQTAIKAHNISEGDYNKSYPVEVSFSSPLDKLYFRVLERADLCMMLNYNLWIEQALHPDYQKNENLRTDNEWEVKRLIKNVNLQVIMNYRRLLNHINRDQRVARGNSADQSPNQPASEVTNISEAKEKPSKKTKPQPVVSVGAEVAVA